jgi:predicted transcriptional regulator
VAYQSLHMSESFDLPLSPDLYRRGPTGGLIEDPRLIDWFRTSVLGESEAHAPSVLAINLEGRFFTTPALHALVIPLGQAVQNRTHGDIKLIFATPDPSARDTIAALANLYSLPLYLAPSINQLSQSEPVGPLTAGEHDTIDLMRRLGGRVTVAQLAEEGGLEQPAAANRLNSVVAHNFVHRVDRPRSEGHLYMAPWVAAPREDAADPTSGDFELSEQLRSDVRELAEAQGRTPEEVYSEALEAFLEHHRAELAAQHAEVARMMKAGDSAGLAAYAKSFSKKRAVESARRAKGH